MKTLTYGTMPDFEEFEAAFDRATEGIGKYFYALKGRDAETAWNADIPVRAGIELQARTMYGYIEKLIDVWENEDDEDEAAMAGDLASSFLTSLGFEWV